MNKKIIAIFIFILFFSNLVFSEPPTESIAQSQARLIIGTIHKVPAKGLKRVAIADPKIADIADANASEIILEAKSFGRTTLSYTDDLGEHTVYVRVWERDLGDLEQRIDNILQDSGLLNIETKINEDEGKVFLLGYVLNSEEKERLDKVMALVKGDVVDLVRLQEEEIPIEIDVEIAELNKNDVDKLGVKWVSSDTGTIAVITEHPFTAPAADADKMKDAGRRLGEALRIGYATRGVGTSNVGLQATINMLIQRGKGRILSRPKIVCLSGKEADLIVGGEIPVVTLSQSTTTTSTNVEYKQYGISLKIKPVVKPGNHITARLITEVSDIDTTNAILAGTIGNTNTNIIIPAFTTERAETELFLNDGETVVLAGLIKNKETKTVQRLPFLGKIPIINTFFKANDVTTRQTELVISLTPRILKSSPSRAAATATLEPTQTPAETKAPFTKVESKPALYQYAQYIQDNISKAITYPEDAAYAGWGDKVVLSLRISPDGTLQETVLKEASKYNILNEAVLTVAKAQSPYPALPPGLSDKSIWIDIPIIFQESQGADK